MTETQPRSLAIESVKLYSVTAKNITSEDAVAMFRQISALTRENTAIGLLYSSKQCQLTRVTLSGLTDRNDAPVALGGIFELRIVNETHELRWLNQSNNSGIAVVLTESPIDSQSKMSVGASSVVWSEPRIQEVEANRDHRYIVWGEAKHEDHGWTSMTDARIGEIALPITGVAPKQRVEVRAVEYLAVADDDGNTIVVEERLTGLHPLETP